MEHQQRVAAHFPISSVEHKVALFHDHIEDCLGEVPELIRPHVEVLTRGEGETYYEYIMRIKNSGDEVAIRVKKADARDNIARCRGEYGGEINPKRENRYRWVLKTL